MWSCHARAGPGLAAQAGPSRAGLGRDGLGREELNNILDTHYREGFNASQVEILNTVSWSYFPRWSPAEAGQGRHWQVFEMQGRGNMWYGGASVSFESVKSVLEYNNLLLRQMDKGLTRP